MPEPHIKRAPTADALNHEVATWLIDQIAAKQGNFSISLSGGHTPQHLYELLATEPYASRIPWDRTHFFFGDERFVPHDDADSNYRMVRQALFDHVPIPQQNIYPVPFGPAITEAAADYERTLRAYFGNEPAGPAHKLFDLAFMGLGEDGHTASLMPGSVALQEQHAWVVPVTDSDKPQPRITLTYPVFAASETVAFLVEGAAKASILNAVLGGDHRYPSSRVTARKNLIWFTDEAAWHVPG